MTYLVASFFADKLNELQTKARTAWADGAEAIEVRVDSWDDSPESLNEFLRNNRDHVWIVTCRSSEEGGQFRGDTQERVSLLIAAARGTGAYVDFELADFKRSANIAQKIHLAADGHANDSPRLILSAHEFAEKLPDVDALVADCRTQDPNAIFKCAYKVTNPSDSFPALDLMHDFGSSVCGIAMGESGLWTRVLAKKFGAFATYCATAGNSPTAPGQISVREMIDRFRSPQISKSTRVFGVLGDPVAQSMSPALFNHWFEENQIDAVYLPMLLHDDGCELFRFLDGCMKRSWLDIGGFSVTKPHKTSVLRWLGERVDRTAQLIGAINTIVMHDGTPMGYNTDSYAAVDSLVSAMEISRVELAELSIDILGSGGAARALLTALSEIGCRITIYGRSPSTTAQLAEYFNATAADWESRANRRGDVIVNCTSVGMAPDVESSPLPRHAFGNCRMAFDMIYNPQKTRFLFDAESAGMPILNGLDMFMRQAINQFELWTGKRPDADSGLRLVKRKLAFLEPDPSPSGSQHND